MLETRYQKLICDVVKDHGGFAFKTSNRFLIGVPDLFVQLVEGAFIEVKRDQWTSKTQSVDVLITAKQDQYLKNLEAAGMRLAGVASFVERGSFMLGFAIRSYSDYRVSREFREDVYQWSPKRTQKTLIWNVVREYFLS